MTQRLVSQQQSEFGTFILRGGRLSTGSGVLDLVAACYRLAIKDAQRGVTEATEFLDVTAPDWRLLATAQATKRPRTGETVRNVQSGRPHSANV